MAAVLIGTGFSLSALLLRVLLNPILEGTVPFLTFFPAVIIASLWSGRLGGALCVGLSACFGWYFLSSPTHAFDWGGTAVIASMAFLLMAGPIVWLGEQLKRSIESLDDYANHQVIVARELQHRVKNTLAIVHSLAVQTSRTAPSMQQFRADFGDRLVALGAAHNLISDADWREVSVQELADHVLAPFTDPQQKRFRIEGPKLLISPELAVSLSLCLHELATNALKYGALSCASGVVDINWQIEQQGRRATLTWRELGGPSVLPAATEGFGMRLLTTGLNQSCHPEISLELPPSGLVWRASFDLPAVDADSLTPPSRKPLT